MRGGAGGIRGSAVNGKVGEVGVGCRGWLASSVLSPSLGGNLPSSLSLVD
jgi:hypothetical protein